MRRHDRFVLTFLVAGQLAACSCGSHLRAVKDPPPATSCAATGSIAGRVCAPDARTWLGGATVEVSGQDCSGGSFHRQVESAADGSFTLPGVPPGKWELHIALGTFTHSASVDVAPGAQLRLPDDRACLDPIQAAVVQGHGDRIETLLTNLKVKVTTFDGNTGGYTTSALPLLRDLQALKKFDILFIDCAAASAKGQIDLGDPKVAEALKAYVEQGGSVYASDWAFLFVEQAFPDRFNFDINGGSAKATNPFDTTMLLGYAPQDVTATVNDPKLANFLGKQSVKISFPRDQKTHTITVHWGLMQDAPPGVNVLLAGNARMCAPSDRACSKSAGTAQNIPLAVTFHAGPEGRNGGNVVYTSFHNVEQSNSDVEQILTYLIFHL